MLHLISPQSSQADELSTIIIPIYKGEHQGSETIAIRLKFQLLSIFHIPIYSDPWLLLHFHLLPDSGSWYSSHNEFSSQIDQSPTSGSLHLLFSAWNTHISLTQSRPAPPVSQLKYHLCKEVFSNHCRETGIFSPWSLSSTLYFYSTQHNLRNFYLLLKFTCLLSATHIGIYIPREQCLCQFPSPLFPVPGILFGTY